MRMYQFVLTFLKPIQYGIQGGHSVVELMAKYPKNKDVREFALKHKTFIVLDGGTYPQMAELLKHISHKSNPYPWAEFREPDMSETPVLTSIAILLPEKLYSDELVSSEWESRFLKLKGQCRLAV